MCVRMRGTMVTLPTLSAGARDSWHFAAAARRRPHTIPNATHSRTVQPATCHQRWPLTKRQCAAQLVAAAGAACQEMGDAWTPVRIAFSAALSAAATSSAARLRATARPRASDPL